MDIDQIDNLAHSPAVPMSEGDNSAKEENTQESRASPGLIKRFEFSKRVVWRSYVLKQFDNEPWCRVFNGQL